MPIAQGGYRLAGDVQSGVGCGDERSPGAYGRFGAEPLQGALRDAVSQLSGVDIVGAGGTPPLDITIQQGEDIGLQHAEAACNQSRKCRSFNSTSCKLNGAGVSCRETLTSKLKKGRKKTCKQTILYTADTGTIVDTPLGSKKCKKSK